MKYTQDPWSTAFAQSLADEPERLTLPLVDGRPAGDGLPFKSAAEPTPAPPDEESDATQRPTMPLLPYGKGRVVELRIAKEEEEDPPPESAPSSRHRARSPREPSSQRTPVPFAAERAPAPNRAPDRSLLVLVIIAGFGIVNAAAWVVVMSIKGGSASGTMNAEPKSGASMQVATMAAQVPPPIPQSSEPAPDGGDAGTAASVSTGARPRVVVSTPRALTAPAKPARAAGSEVVDPWRQ